MKTIKVEEVYLVGNEKFDNTVTRLPYFFEEIYNGLRMHSAINQLIISKHNSLGKARNFSAIMRRAFFDQLRNYQYGRGIMFFKRSAVIVFSLVLTACATGYGSMGFTGGYRDMHVAEDVYRISYAGNGPATRETIQTYWLYRATELTIEKGFDGFEIISPLQLGATTTELKQKVQMIFIPMPDNSRKSFLEADIRLLKGPIKATPPRLFDARELQTALEPYVKAEKKCNEGNVCPHIKRYLQPRPDRAIQKEDKSI